MPCRQAYFAKKNIRKLKKAGLIPNIVPQERDYSDATLKRAVREYDAKLRKKNRGLVETPFGGLETEQGMRTRCRKPRHRNIFTCLLGLKHNIKTLLRAEALKWLDYFRTNLPAVLLFIVTFNNLARSMGLVNLNLCLNLSIFDHP
jgi:hypothetical protein